MLQKGNALYRVIEEAVIRDFPERSGKDLQRRKKGRVLRVTGILPTGWLQVSEKRLQISNGSPAGGPPFRPESMYALIFQCHGWNSGPKF